MAHKRGAWHWPKLYRYRVAPDVAGARLGWNRYESPIRTTIGAYVVVGAYSYCVKWRWAR